MDPISLIVAALVGGLTSGLQDATHETVMAGYRGLRDRLADRYGAGVRSSMADLERDPRSPQVQAAVAHRLREAGASNERELANLAASLMRLIEHPDEALADPAERLRRTGGFNSMADVLYRHIGAIIGVRSQYHIPDEQLLSTRIGRQNQLPVQHRQQLASLHARMRSIIVQVATSIEEARYREVDLALQNMPGGLGVQQRAATLVRADKQLHISYETLRLTVEYFSELNQQAIRSIESSGSIQQESNMMFGNAILLVELTDFVIAFIESFTFDDAIDELHQEALAQIRKLREQQSALGSRLQTDPTIEQTVRDYTLADIANREAALREVEREWDSYISEVRKLRSTVGDVRSKLPTLQVIRENAQLQIQTLQLVAMLRFLKQNSESVRGAVASLQGFRLAPLSPTRVRRLLGMSDAVG